jgi:hypothetical protein
MLGQRAGVVQTRPTGDLPGDIADQLLARLPVGQALQRLQHHHGGGDVGGDRGPASARGEQIGEQLVGEPLSAVVGEEGVHGAVGDQVAAVRLGVEELNAVGPFIPCMHVSLSNPTRQHEFLSRLLVQRVRRCQPGKEYAVTVWLQAAGPAR